MQVGDILYHLVIADDKVKDLEIIEVTYIQPIGYVQQLCGPDNLYLTGINRLTSKTILTYIPKSSDKDVGIINFGRIIHYYTTNFEKIKELYKKLEIEDVE